MLSLGLVACSKSELSNQAGAEQEHTAQHFELNTSLGGVKVLELNSEIVHQSNLNEDYLRANLHFNGVKKITTTTFSAADLGVRMNGTTAGDKINARWGVIYGTNQYLAKNCTKSVTTPQFASAENIVYFQPNTSSSTINGAKLKMYCYSAETLGNVQKGWLCLDGVEGTEANSTKQYFMSEQGGRAIKTDPNERIEGVAKGNFQKDRHIPVMTDVVPFSVLTSKSASVRFAPRGSLLGLCLENKLGSDITVTSIVVEKAGAFAYSGYFDWSVGSGRATFTPEYTASQNTTALVFPVYTKGSNTTGYTVANGNTEFPCFYLWGMQKEAKKGNAMQVQIRYKLAGSSEEKTSMTFNIYAPDSQTENGVKKFDEGYAYNAVITLKEGNKTGGSTGKEWNNGGVLPTNNGCPNNGNTGGHVCPKTVKGGKTPLDFVAEYDVNNAPAGQKALRNSYSLPVTNVVANLRSTDVGYYTWEEAVALFDGSNPALANYYLPSQSQWLSIIPSADAHTSIYFREIVPIFFGQVKPKTEDAQIGELPGRNYSAEYTLSLKRGTLL